MLIFGSYLLTKNLSVEQPGRVQLLLESAYQTAADFFGELLGENGLRYIPYLLSVLVYIAAANLIGILEMKPPTKDLGVTAGLIRWLKGKDHYGCKRIYGTADSVKRVRM